MLLKIIKFLFLMKKVAKSVVLPLNLLSLFICLHVL